MSDYSNIPLGLKITTQIPLDVKTYIKDEASLIDLGLNNNLAFTYVKGMSFYCIAEGTRYEWRPAIGAESGLMASNFTYPANIESFGIIYSNVQYNFFSSSTSASGLQQVLNVSNSALEKDITLVSNTTVSSVLSPIELNFNHPIANLSLAYQSNGIFSFNQNAKAGNYTGLQFPVNTGNNVIFQTPLIAAGTYTLATTDEVNAIDLQKVINVGGYAELGDPNSSIEFASSVDDITDREVNLKIGTAIEVNDLQIDYIRAGLNSSNYELGNYASIKAENQNVFLNVKAGAYGTTITSLKPLIDTTLNFPAKTVAGTYTISTLDDITFEKTGTGVFLRGRTTANYGTPGNRSFDVSYAFTPSAGTPYGATGSYSFAVGSRVSSSGYNAASFGYLIDNGGIGSFNSGYNLYDRGYTNFLAGVGHNVTSMNAAVIGQAANIINEGTTDWNAYPTKALFTIGNGTIQNADNFYTVLSRSDAFKVRFNGSVEAPSLTTALISADVTGKILITKEYLSNTQNLQKVINYPADFTGTNYTLTSVDMGYSIIVNNSTTAVTITIPTGLTSKINVGFIQQGTADVSFVSSGTTINTPVGLKIKGQNYNAYIEKVGVTETYQLLGNLKI